MRLCEISAEAKARDTEAELTRLRAELAKANVREHEEYHIQNAAIVRLQEENAGLIAELEKLRADAGRSKTQLADLKMLAARALGEHNSPSDCYSTGPLTGDPIVDLVQCPGCALKNALRAEGGGE